MVLHNFVMAIIAAGRGGGGGGGRGEDRNGSSAYAVKRVTLIVEFD